MYRVSLVAGSTVWGLWPQDTLADVLTEAVHLTFFVLEITGGK
jgi:hypothetical protein